MLKLFDTVTLKNDDPETGVKAGTEGTIVDVLGNGKAFTVEFFESANVFVVFCFSADYNISCSGIQYFIDCKLFASDRRRRRSTIP